MSRSRQPADSARSQLSPEQYLEQVAVRERVACPRCLDVIVEAQRVTAAQLRVEPCGHYVSIRRTFGGVSR